MGVDPEVADEETGNADSNGSRLARLDDVERDSSSQGVSKADQRKSNLKEETARKVQDFRRPEAVVGISARYVPPSALKPTWSTLKRTALALTLVNEAVIW